MDSPVSMIGGMRGWMAGALIAACLLAAWPAGAGAATAVEVDKAIENAKAYIYSQQRDDNWEPVGVPQMFQNGGQTALATYALLASGENANDPRIKKAIQYLLHCNMQGIYAIGFRTQVWALLPQPYPPEIRAAIKADGLALLKAAHPANFPFINGINAPRFFRGAPMQNGPATSARAFYRYRTDSKDWDHSNSQYGVLGIWACEQAGFEVPTAYWQAIDAGWRAHQYPDGGWSYDSYPNEGRAGAAVAAANQRSPDESATMTAAGIATLFIAQEYLHGNDGMECRGNIVDHNIEAGLNWMSEHFDDIYKGGRACYGLYGIERIGDASGRKYFGTTDWYKEGADYLVKRVFRGAGGANIYNTAFALLFLARGRAPVVMNKLQYDITAPGQKPREARWNQRPRDAANLTRWIGKQDELTLNWQVVNLKVPAADLHEAPILYIAGNEALSFTDEEIAKLRQFVEEGGMILANSDCENPAFNQSLIKVCAKMFPLYEFRTLPEQSPIYNDEQFRKDRWRSPMTVKALSNGVRELVVTFPANDPARYWQIQYAAGHNEMFELPNDIYLYSIDKGAQGGLRNKGETYVVTPDDNIHPSRRLKVARLQFSGNWNPEPGSWRRLTAILHNTQDLDLDVQTVKLGVGQLDQSFPLADLTGTYRFMLTDKQRDEIKKYVQAGGTLIVDAAGGDQAFALSAQTELGSTFPNSKLDPQPLALNDPVYGRGPRLDQVEYRRFAKKLLDKLNTPRIRAMRINGRPAVLFSAEDLSCGMVGMQVDGVYGYDPASATSLMEKLVLFVAPAPAVVKAKVAEPTGAPATPRPAERSVTRVRRESRTVAPPAKPQDVAALIEEMKSGSVMKRGVAAAILFRAAPDDKFRADVLAQLRPLVQDPTDVRWITYVRTYCRWADAGELKTVKEILAASDQRKGMHQKQEAAASACAALLKMDVPATVDAINARLDDGMFRVILISDLRPAPGSSDPSNDLAYEVLGQLTYYRPGMKIAVGAHR